MTSETPLQHLTALIFSKWNAYTGGRRSLGTGKVDLARHRKRAVLLRPKAGAGSPRWRWGISPTQSGITALSGSQLKGTSGSAYRQQCLFHASFQGLFVMCSWVWRSQWGPKDEEFSREIAKLMTPRPPPPSHRENCPWAHGLKNGSNLPRPRPSDNVLSLFPSACGFFYCYCVVTAFSVEAGGLLACGDGDFSHPDKRLGADIKQPFKSRLLFFRRRQLHRYGPKIETRRAWGRLLSVAQSLSKNSVL